MQVRRYIVSITLMNEYIASTDFYRCHWYVLFPGFKSIVMVLQPERAEHDYRYCKCCCSPVSKMHHAHFQHIGLLFKFDGVPLGVPEYQNRRI